jgi:hypothetical protein
LLGCGSASSVDVSSRHLVVLRRYCHVSRHNLGIHCNVVTCLLLQIVSLLGCYLLRILVVLLASLLIMLEGAAKFVNDMVVALAVTIHLDLVLLGSSITLLVYQTGVLLH